MRYTWLLLLLVSCANKSIDNDKAAIINLLKQEQTAHLNKDVNLFISEFADGVYMINKGVVSQPSNEEQKTKVQNYFDHAVFKKWDDVAEPIIKFSDDHSLAYAIIQKQVILEVRDVSGQPMSDTTNFAWVSIYRKQQSSWKLECNVSTNK